MQISLAGASRHEKEAAIDRGLVAFGEMAEWFEMRATGIVGQARCDNDARMAVLGGLRRVV